MTLARNGSDFPLGSSDGLRISAQQPVGLRRSHTHTEEAPLDGAPKYQFANRLTRTSAHPEQGRAFGCAQHGRPSGRLWVPAMRKPHAVATHPPDRRALRALALSVGILRPILWTPRPSVGFGARQVLRTTLVLAHPTLRALPDSGQLWGPARVLASDNRSGGCFETHRNGPRRSQVVV